MSTLSILYILENLRSPGQIGGMTTRMSGNTDLRLLRTAGEVREVTRMIARRLYRIDHSFIG